jgi:hypothetical protein
VIVYGDVERVEPAGELIERLRRLLEQAAGAKGLARHALFATLLIEAGCLAQGFADRAMECEGADLPSPEEDAALDLAVAVGRALLASWDGGFADEIPLPAWPEALAGTAPDLALRLKLPEGYAFYALYPESYALAARRSGLGHETRIVGIRSIGTSLAAIVAAALGTGRPETVRPVGHPFGRSLQPTPARADRLLPAPGALALVDEGPGLSGSSFGAVADWLEARGVPENRLHVFPSHAGDLGPQASDGHRARWARLQRHLVPSDMVLRLGEALPRPVTWAADLIGHPVAPVKDVCGGAWRSERRFSETPPTQAHQERIKLLVRTGSGAWLLKFIGLGEEGARKADLARCLADAALTPAVVGLRHGFIVERWHGDASPIDGIGKDALVAHLARYLGFRARSLRPGPRGASLGTLAAMVVHNSEQAGLDDLSSAHRRALAGAAQLKRSVYPVTIDGRLQPWEWLLTPGGQILKTDAVDHHCAHDLIGCQDIAWDVAGAAVEFSLDGTDRERLRAGVATVANREVDPALVAFYEPCYLAFQLGSFTMADQALSGWPDEAQRLNAHANRYRDRLSR